MSSHDSFAASGSSPTQREEIPPPPDFLLEDHFSIFLIRPLTESAHAWLEENIDAAGSFQPYFPTIVVEHRYIADIVEGIRSDGLTVQQTLGTGFSVQDINDHSLHLGTGIELVQATPQELQQWGQERIQARNEYLANTDTQTLRREAKVEAVANRQNHALTAFEKELEANLTREITIGGLPRLPDNWNGKRLDREFIRRADKETLLQIMKRFGSSQLTARLHGISKVGNFTLD